MKRPTSISEALRLARKRYATGGSPSYGDTAYEQLLKDIAAQKAKALPDIPGLRRDPVKVAESAPAAVKHELGGYEPVAEPVVKPPVTGGGGGGDGLSSSYGLPSATPEGIMSSTSTGAAAPAGATPGFSFTGAPIGAVQAYDLPAPEPAAPLEARSVQTTSVAPTPGMFSGSYIGQPAVQNNAVANQAALGAQVGAQVGNALNTIGTSPTAAAPAASTGQSSGPFGAIGPGPQNNQSVFDTMGNVAVPGANPYGATPSAAAPAASTGSSSKGTTPGVQQPSFVAPPAFPTAEELGDIPADMIGSTPAGAAFTAGMADQSISGETGSFGAAGTSSGSTSNSAAPGSAPASATPSSDAAPSQSFGISLSSPVGATVSGAPLNAVNPAELEDLAEPQPDAIPENVLNMVNEADISAPDAPNAPAAPAAPAAPSVSAQNNSQDAAPAAATPSAPPAAAQSDDDAAAADAAAAAAASEAAAAADAAAGDSSAGLGDGSIGGGAWGDSSSSDSSSSSSDGSSSSSDGDGGGGDGGGDGGGGDGGGDGGGGSEKRGGFVSKISRVARDNMVKKALDVSAKRRPKAKLQKAKGRSVVEQAVVVASKLANRQRGRP